MLALAAGLVTALALTPWHVKWWLRALAGWDAGALTLALLAWSIIVTAGAAESRQRAGVDDPGRTMLFLIAVSSSVVSLFAAGFVLHAVKGLRTGDAALWTTLAFAAVMLSWTVTHTSYTLRYAHMYYRDGGKRDKAGSNGIQFPGSEEPADIDFAYFAFTIAMCFQVSDVVVTTSLMRREVLVHSVLSFVYNTMIIALALNIAINALS